MLLLFAGGPSLLGHQLNKYGQLLLVCGVMIRLFTLQHDGGVIDFGIFWFHFVREVCVK